MLREKEIMIGDWVYSTFAEHPCKVEGIEWTESGYAYVKISGVDGYKCIESLSPIPLTTDILEKNGFVESHINECFSLRYTLIYDGIGFSLKYVRSVFQWLGPLDFKYVHELQHALKLCGIKKEIEL